MDQQEVIERQNEEVEAAKDAAQEVSQAQPELNSESKEPETMQELLDQYGSSVRLRKGEVRTGTIVSKNENGWLVNVGFKCEGLLPIREYTNHSLIETGEEPKPGDKI
ncbi:MAG: S1 RNA-binding domain-containing protein, partial [Synergistaceae bacterium]|nr:S1 RNA-binding domain-containing protein [Synergistaceae bacterium]